MAGEAEEEVVEAGRARPGDNEMQVVSKLRRVQHWPRQHQAMIDKYMVNAVEPQVTCGCRVEQGRRYD